MTKSIDYQDGDYRCTVEVDGRTFDLGTAATVGLGDVLCNEFLIAYYELSSTPELAASLANVAAGHHTNGGTL